MKSKTFIILIVICVVLAGSAYFVLNNDVKESTDEKIGGKLFADLDLNAVAAVRIESAEGEVNLKIPAGSQSGRVFRLRGKGVKPVRGGSVGDLLCRAVVETPVNLNKQQKEMLREFQDSLGEGGKSQSPRQTSWFEGVKSFFDDMKI